MAETGRSACLECSKELRQWLVQGCGSPRPGRTFFASWIDQGWNDELLAQILPPSPTPSRASWFRCLTKVEERPPCLYVIEVDGEKKVKGCYCIYHGDETRGPHPAVKEALEDWSERQVLRKTGLACAGAGLLLSLLLCCSGLLRRRGRSLDG